MLKPAVALPFTQILILVLAGCGSSSNGTACAGPCPAQSASYVYVTGVSGEVAVFPVDAATGALGTPSTSPGPSASLGIATVNNTFLYASESRSSGSIDAWTIDQNTGQLNLVAGSPFTLGAFSLPAGLAAANKFLYVADVGKIDAFEAGSMGILSAVPGSPFAAGINLYLALDPRDRFLFAANDRPPASVLGFSIDPSTGALTPVPGASFPVTTNGTSPVQLGQIVVDATGKLYTSRSHSAIKSWRSRSRPMDL